MERRRWFWLGLVGVLCVAAVPRLLIYDFSLPYIDHPDEPNYYLEVQRWRGLYERGGDIVGFPPAFLAVGYGVQALVEGVLGYGMTATIAVTRLLSVSVTVVMLATLALTARLLAGDAAGLLAPLPWLLSPILVPQTVYATADPHVYLWAALAFGAAVLAIVRDPRWAVASTAAGLVAFLFKYSALPLVALGGVTTLALWVGRPADRRRLAGLLAGQVALAGAVGLWVLFGYGAGQMDIAETNTFRSEALSNLLTPSRTWQNLWVVFAPLNGAVVVVAGGLVATLAGRYADRHIRLVLVPAVFALCALPWFVSSYHVVSLTSRLKDVLPVTTVASVLFGVYLAGLARWIARPRLAWGAVVAGLALVYGPPAAAMLRSVPAYRAPDTRVELRLWAGENLEAGTVLVDHSNHKTFNPFWGGVQGRQWFDWWETDAFTRYTVETWQADHQIRYAVIPLERRDELAASDEGAAFLNELLPLRTINPDGGRGPAVTVYRLDGIENPLDITFGGALTLRGTDALPGTVAPGEAIPLRFYWFAPVKPSGNYNLFVHLLPPGRSDPVAQWDGPPAVSSRLTLTWTDPDETLISPARSLVVPPGTPPGEYRLVAGLYNFETGERLPVDGGEAALLATVTVVD